MTVLFKPVIEDRFAEQLLTIVVKNRFLQWFGFVQSQWNLKVSHKK